MPLSWGRIVVLSLGSALLVNVSLGPMASAIGAASIVVWALTAFVGFAQCLLLGELGSRYPDVVGGPAAYVHEAFKDRSQALGALCAWAYWTAWIPGVGVHVVLAAEYVRAAVWPGADVALLVVVLVVVLYALNYFGLSLLFWTSSAFAVCAITPLLVILGVSLFGSFERALNVNSWFPTGIWPSLGLWLPLTKWMFVATWSSYGGEMATTLVGGLRDRRRNIPRVLAVAGLLTFLAFTVVPVALLANIGADALAADPYIVFLTAARGTFGAAGTTVISIMLIAALLSGAQLFIVSSSRALYEMSRNGLTVLAFGRVNAHGVPVGSVGWDALVTLGLLAIFRENIVNVVAAANVSYLVVFVLLPAAYLAIRRSERPARGTRTLPRWMDIVAGAALVLNAILLVVGGLQWGATVVGVGIALMIAGMPLYLHRQRRVRRVETVA
jgi:amino acid transporter